MNWDSERFFQEAINLIDAKFMAKIEKEALEDREIVTKTMIEKNQISAKTAEEVYDLCEGDLDEIQRWIKQNLKTRQDSTLSNPL